MKKNIKNPPNVQFFFFRTKDISFSLSLSRALPRSPLSWIVFISTLNWRQVPPRALSVSITRLRPAERLWTKQGTLRMAGGVFTYYQRRRKQGSGRKGGIKERWRKKRLRWCISDDRATSSRRWPVQETAHFHSEGEEAAPRCTQRPTDSTTCLSNCRTDLNRQAQTSAGCYQALCANVRVRNTGGLWAASSFCNTTYLLSAPRLMIMWMQCEHVLLVALLEKRRLYLVDPTLALLMRIEYKLEI